MTHLYIRGMPETSLKVGLCALIDLFLGQLSLDRYQCAWSGICWLA